jgi:hypothetical protein
MPNVSPNVAHRIVQAIYDGKNYASEIMKQANVSYADISRAISAGILTATDTIPARLELTAKGMMLL